jgi:predicted transcriptional regulator of viral defense system
MTQTREIRSVLETFRQNGGTLRTSHALRKGIHPAALYGLVKTGQITRLTRGLYRLSSVREFSNPDLAIVAVRAPETVVCLISALAFHGITTQIPRQVHLAVPRGKYAGLRLRTPPVKIYRFDPATFDRGVEVHNIDGMTVRIYGVARTLVDCFKYRNKLGLDIAVEALRFARDRKKIRNREIIQFARLLRQVRVMAPYLESVV